jgi:FixJ family two-component response regulator
MTANNDRPTVYVIDDDPLIRKSLECLFELEGISSRSFPSAEDFLRNCSADGHGCLLLDVKMPGLSGLQLQNELDALGILLPIIFMTGHGNIPMSVQAMRAGAVNFLQKPFDDSALLDAVREAMDQDARDGQERNALADACGLIESLSPREKEVLAMVAGGMLNKQIARRLDIKEGTVKAHRSHIMDKLQVTSVAELAILAERAGIERVSR